MLPVSGEAELRVGLRKLPFLRKSHVGREGDFCFSLALAPFTLSLTRFASSSTSQLTFLTELGSSQLQMMKGERKKKKNVNVTPILLGT